MVLWAPDVSKGCMLSEHLNSERPTTIPNRLLSMPPSGRWPVKGDRFPNQLDLTADMRLAF